MEGACVGSRRRAKDVGRFGGAADDGYATVDGSGGGYVEAEQGGTAGRAPGQSTDADAGRWGEGGEGKGSPRGPGPSPCSSFLDAFALS